MQQERSGTISARTRAARHDTLTHAGATGRERDAHEHERARFEAQIDSEVRAPLTCGDTAGRRAASATCTNLATL